MIISLMYGTVYMVLKVKEVARIMVSVLLNIFSKQFLDRCLDDIGRKIEFRKAARIHRT